MAYLLEHLPPQVHLVISTRVDPALPLARLRAAGQLVEIRAADLRFTLTEAATYLNDVGASTSRPSDVAALEGRTEGWIAALQLAALSLQGRADVSAFIAGFAGDDRYIVDYLAEEVLDRQPSQVRDFLLETSILDRLSGPLCDAVTGTAGGTDHARALDRTNLFLVPLDEHPPAGTATTTCSPTSSRPISSTSGPTRRGASPPRQRVVRAGRRRRTGGPALARCRRRRSSGGSDRAGHPDDARDRREAEALRLGPVLAGRGGRRPTGPGGRLRGALMLVAQFDTVAERLDDIERSLRARPDDPWPEQPPPGLIVVDQRGYQRLPGTIELYRAALALATGDLAARLPTRPRPWPWPGRTRT